MPEDRMVVCDDRIGPRVMYFQQAITKDSLACWKSVGHSLEGICLLVIQAVDSMVPLHHEPHPSRNHHLSSVLYRRLGSS